MSRCQVLASDNWVYSPIWVLKLAALAAVGMSLSGCLTTLAMEGLNGIKPCPPGVANTAMSNAAVLDYAKPGDNVQVLSSLSAPEKRHTVLLTDGTPVDILGFRTGHPDCRYLPTEEELTPVALTHDGRILAIGAEQVYRFRTLQVVTDRRR